MKKVMRISSASIASHYRLTIARRNYWVTHAQLEHDRGQSIARRVHGAAGLGRNMLRTRRGALLQLEAVGGTCTNETPIAKSSAILCLVAHST